MVDSYLHQDEGGVDGFEGGKGDNVYGHRHHCHSDDNKKYIRHSKAAKALYTRGGKGIEKQNAAPQGFRTYFMHIVCDSPPPLHNACPKSAIIGV